MQGLDDKNDRVMKQKDKITEFYDKETGRTYELSSVFYRGYCRCNCCKVWKLKMINNEN
jgi:cyclopropane fatty-acyl-phospholipid synthase-like methyltransferase